MPDDPTVIGLLIATIGTLAGIIGWLVKRLLKVMEKLMEIVKDNATAFTECSRAIESNTEMNKNMMKVIQDYLLPPKS